jgi:hypothetical protein
VDFSPDRWHIVQDMLKLVAKFSPQAKGETPHSIVVDATWNHFPYIRILNREPWDRDRFMMLNTDHIFDHGLHGHPRLKEDEKREAAFSYLRNPNIDPIETEIVHRTNICQAKSNLF